MRNESPPSDEQLSEPSSPILMPQRKPAVPFDEWARQQDELIDARFKRNGAQNQAGGGSLDRYRHWQETTCNTAYDEIRLFNHRISWPSERRACRYV